MDKEGIINFEFFHELNSDGDCEQEFVAPIFIPGGKGKCAYRVSTTV